MVFKSVLVSIAVFFCVGEAQDLEFNPKPGSRLVKEFESRLDLKLEELTIQHDASGERLSHLWSDGSVAEERRSVFIDDYTTSSQHPTSRLLRTFETLELKQKVDWDNLSNDADFHNGYSGRSPLESKRVRFIGGARQSSSTVKFDGASDHDEKLLEGLVEDVDFRVFLPGDSNRSKKTWSVDASTLRLILEPGGRIGFVDTDGHELRSFDPGFAGALKGTLQVELAEQRELAQGRVAVLRIHGKPIAAMVPVVSRGEVQLGLGYTEPGTNTVNASLELDVSGEILWALEGLRLHSAQLTADVVVKRETQGELTGGVWSETWVRETWRGKLKLEARVTRK